MTTPPAPQSPAYGGAPAARWNVLAIVGFILAFFVSLAGLICSAIAYNQIKRTGEQGRGLALAGIIISIVGLIIGIIYVIFAVVIGVSAVNSGTY